MTITALRPGSSGEDGTVAARIRAGVARLRPLGPGETAPLLAVFDGMSPASRAQRYLTGMAALPTAMLGALTAVDGERHVAWLGAVDGVPAGVARYVLASPGVAEVAFEVADAFQGRGLGTVLLDAVTTVAAARGVRRVRATVHPTNAVSRHLVGRLGLPLVLSDGLLEGEGPLRLVDPPRVDRRAVVRAALRTVPDGRRTGTEWPCTFPSVPAH
jgi:GNAT superfamily N-acetyltransferase